ncbi:CPBP family intramembrane glutamic endopeptidase [Myroides sp. LJL116]
MKYIEQLLKKKHKVNLWLYLPFSLLFFGIMALNAVVLKLTDASTNDIIRQNIALYGKNINFLLTIGPLVGLLFVLLLWVKLIQKQSILTLTTSRDKIDWNRIGFAFMLWSAICIFLFVISYIANPQDFQWNFKPASFFTFLVLAVALVPLQTSFEEYFLRGYLLQGLGLATKSRGVAFILTSFIFGLMHFANPEVDQNGMSIMIYYIGTGVFLGMITLIDEGLELALGFHAANNLVGVLLVTSSWTAFQTDSLFINTDNDSVVGVWEYLAQVGIILPLVFFIFAKKYKWRNYSKHLFGAVK